MTAPDNQSMPPSPETDAHSAAIPPIQSEAEQSHVEPIGDLEEDDDDEFEDDDEWDDDDDDDEFDDWEDEDDEIEDAEDAAE